MEKHITGKLLILAGLFPFILAIIDATNALRQASGFDFTLFWNQILLYSTEHWFTYLMGFTLVLVGIKHELRK